MGSGAVSLIDYREAPLPRAACKKPRKDSPSASIDRRVARNLLVITTHGCRGLARMLRGRVAEAFLRKATRPVLAISGKFLCARRRQEMTASVTHEKGIEPRRS